MSNRALSCVFAVAVTLTLAVGCGSSADDQPSATPSAVPSAAPSSEAPAGTPSSAPAPSVPPGNSPSSAPGEPQPSATAGDKLKRGAKGDRVVALQTRLNELGYWNGKADGSFGSLTQQAVYALQKAAGLGRDGVVGTKTQKALDQGVRPKARTTAGYVVEIDRKRQLLMLVDGGQVQQIFNTSTGSYERYEQIGQTYLADTPAGSFTVSRQINGWRDAPLGLLWRPKYFNGGIAVHGSHSIPPYAASHGCARLSIQAMNWIWTNDKMPIKTKVKVY